MASRFPFCERGRYEPISATTCCSNTAPFSSAWLLALLPRLSAISYLSFGLLRSTQN